MGVFAAITIVINVCTSHEECRKIPQVIFPFKVLYAHVFGYLYIFIAIKVQNIVFSVIFMNSVLILQLS